MSGETGGAVLRIIDPGLASTLQDAGRIGYRRYGVPVAGALDPHAWRLANALAGAPDGAAAIEARLVGPTVAAEGGPVRVALVGAAARAVMISPEGEETPTPLGPEIWRTVTLPAGGRLKLGPLAGPTAYLAVAGGISVEPVMGSRATSLKGGFGGWRGRVLQPGDRLAVGPGPAAPAGPERMIDWLPSTPARGAPQILRLVLGSQADAVTAASRDRFFETRWTVSAAADRMGLRLDGPALEHSNGHDIVSDGIAAGAIQIPGDGKPILLLADRQTSGGYPKIGAVIGADLPAAGRLAPGMRLSFRAVSPAEGVAAARAAEAALRETLARIGPWRPVGEIDLERLYEANLVTAALPEATGLDDSGP